MTAGYGRLSDSIEFKVYHILQNQLLTNVTVTWEYVCVCMCVCVCLCVCVCMHARGRNSYSIDTKFGT